MTALKQGGTRKLHKMQKLLRKKKLNTVTEHRRSIIGDSTSKINNTAILPVALVSNSLLFIFIRCLVHSHKVIGILIV